MTPERWERLKELLAPALDMGATERTAYLGRIQDPSQRNDVARLLAAERNAGTRFLNDSVAAEFDACSMPGERWIGQRIGPYQIVKEIGEGGMGAVYQAVRADDQYQKQVAVKVLRGGFHGSADLARFKAERQILASLEHPNVTRLLDGGTTDDGLPYLVMELVDGQPIDEYCDAHKLAIPERLELFRGVCSAVQYAHQNLIIHRDLKPGNILVTHDGIPKLLDFGIAKILNPVTLPGSRELTTGFVRALTPEYASPEQIRGETITTASDVYSLGVVLYVLLTGHHPYSLESRSLQDAARGVCGTEPMKPSAVISLTEDLTRADDNHLTLTAEHVSFARSVTPGKLRRQLTGDLDNIMLMALRKDWQRRYSSVEQFEQDIRRHLDGLPVLARRDTLGYRTTKFINRHKAGVIAAGAMALFLFTALIVTLRANRIARQQAEIARMQRERAERRFNDVRKLANSMIFEFPGPIHLVPGSIAVEKMLYDTGLEYLDSLAAEAEGDVSLQRELAAGYKQLGDSQGSPYEGSLGDYRKALSSYRKSLDLRRKLVEGDPQNVSDQIALSKTYRTIGAFLYQTGDVSGARDDVHKALEIIQPIAQTHDDNLEALHEFGIALLTAGGIDGEGLSGGFVGLPSVALRYHLDALNLFRELDEKQPNVFRGRLQIAYMDGIVSTDYLQSGNPNEATRYARDALGVLSQVDNADATTGTLITDQKAAAHSHIGDAMLFSGRWHDAVFQYRSELALFKQLADPKNPRSLRSLADGYINLGQAQSLAGNPSAGLKLIRMGITTVQSRVPSDPTDRDRALLLGSSYVYEGQALEELGDEGGALQSYEKAAAMYEAPTLAVEHVFDSLVAASYGKVAGALTKLGQIRQARETYEKALVRLGSQPRSELAALHVQYAFLEIYSGLARLQSEGARSGNNRADPATNSCEWYSKSRDIWLRMPVRNSISPSGFKVTDFNTISGELAKCQQTPWQP